MNVGNVSTMPNIGFSSHISKESNISNAEFSIPNVEEKKTEITAETDGTTVDAVSVMESMTGKTGVKAPSYTVTDDEAAYIREKYGSIYSNKRAHELYYELADKGIISHNDACASSGVLEVLVMDDSNSITCGNMVRNLRVKGRAFVDDISRTDEHVYKREWNSFKEQYDRDINTWEDALQESIDFENYLKENNDDENRQLHWYFNSVIESLEKTKDVIFKIFG